MRKKTNINNNLISRHRRIRKKINGTTERPRLVVRRSLNHLEAQIIDDLKHATLASATTKSKAFIEANQRCGNVAAAEKLGTLLGEKALSAGLKKVVFDRGGYLYHGRVKAFAEAVRKAGLEF